MRVADFLLAGKPSSRTIRNPLLFSSQSAFRNLD